jgi:hypothetical protein
MNNNKAKYFNFIGRKTVLCLSFVCKCVIVLLLVLSKSCLLYQYHFQFHNFNQHMLWNRRAGR